MGVGAIASAVMVEAVVPSFEITTKRQELLIAMRIGDQSRSHSSYVAEMRQLWLLAKVAVDALVVFG